jgi:hypothetical protein
MLARPRRSMLELLDDTRALGARRCAGIHAAGDVHAAVGAPAPA